MDLAALNDSYVELKMLSTDTIWLAVCLPRQKGAT